MHIGLPQQFRTRYRTTFIWPTNWAMEQDWIWPLNILNGLPNDITRDSQDNYQEITTEMSQQLISLLKDITWKWEDYQEPYSTTPLTKILTEWRKKATRNYHQMACRTECQITIPKAYQCLPRSPRIFYRICLLRSPQGSLLRTHQSHHPDFTEKRPPRPYQMPNQEMPRSGNAMSKAVFWE